MLFDRLRSMRIQSFFSLSGLQIRLAILLVLILGSGLVFSRMQVSDKPVNNFEAWSEDAKILKSKIAEIESGWHAKNAIEEKGEKAEKSLEIDINVANEEELAKLPGIGPELAKRIVVYRKSHGGFATIEELRNVKGIGIKKLEKIKPFLYWN